MKKFLILGVVLMVGCGEPQNFCKYKVEYNVSNGYSAADFVEGEITQVSENCIEYDALNDKWQKGSKVHKKICGTYQIIKLHNP